MPRLFLYKSKSKDKKYKMIFPDGSARFGAKSYRDYTLINSKGNKHYLPNKEDREKVKRSYKARHKRDKDSASVWWERGFSTMTLECKN